MEKIEVVGDPILDNIRREEDSRKMLRRTTKISFADEEDFAYKDDGPHKEDPSPKNKETSEVPALKVVDVVDVSGGYDEEDEKNDAAIKDRPKLRNFVVPM
jgi:hypothetical protein